MPAPVRLRMFPIIDSVLVLLRALPVPARLRMPLVPVKVPLLTSDPKFRVLAPFMANVWLVLIVRVLAATEEPRLTLALLPLTDTVPKPCLDVLSVQICVPVFLKDVVPVPLV